jgi:hypothetical protein
MADAIAPAGLQNRAKICAGRGTILGVGEPTVWTRRSPLAAEIQLESETAMRPNLVRTTLALTILVALLPATASAVIHSFSGTLDGAQANAGAGTGSPGTGSVTATLDSDSLLFSWDASWSGLDGTETAAHFHVAPPNTNGGIAVPVTVPSPTIGSTTITAGQATDLLAGNFYLNVHTDTEPGGEIRGQLSLDAPATPLLDTWAMVLLAALIVATSTYWFVLRQRSADPTA